MQFTNGAVGVGIVVAVEVAAAGGVGDAVRVGNGVGEEGRVIAVGRTAEVAEAAGPLIVTEVTVSGGAAFGGGVQADSTPMKQPSSKINRKDHLFIAPALGGFGGFRHTDAPPPTSRCFDGDDIAGL